MGGRVGLAPFGPATLLGAVVGSLLLVAVSGSLGRVGADAAEPAVPSDEPTDLRGKVGAQPFDGGRLIRARLANIEPSEWYEPPILETPDKVKGPHRLDVTLEVRMAENTVRVFDPWKKTEVDQKVHLRSYNGGLVGPTLKVGAGDTIYLKLDNQLDEKTMTGGHGAAPTVHGLNVTNLHTHGLHISPRPGSDDVLEKVEPKSSRPYRFDILPAGNPHPELPARQYPGTFWYHAHVHGSTAVQLASGMAGALIVRGDIDEHPGVKGARDRLFVFQQLAFDKDGKVQPVNNLAELFANFEGDKLLGIPNPVHGPPKFTTINGRTKPRIRMRPGEVERWRFVDAGVMEMLDIYLVKKASPHDKVPLHQIAVDGITLKTMRDVEHVPLGPGYRTDVMVKAPVERGLYILYKEEAQFNGDRPLKLKAFGPGAPNPPADASTTPPSIGPQWLAEIMVEGESAEGDPSCHSKLPDPNQPLPAPTDMLRDITKDQVMRMKGVEFGNTENTFEVDGKPFDENTVLPKFRLKLGDVEEWLIYNNSSMAHPFHIHVNAFQLVDASGKLGDWADTVLVPPKGEVRLRTRYERFTGRFVLHCHILIHEDKGMMQLVEIVE
jgi:FtsP/CotA-like multicopper oxidase with cupredoxin domain